MKLSFQEGLYPVGDFCEFLSELKEWGFDAVEVWGEGLGERLADVASAVKEAGLPVSSICPGGGGIRGSLLSVESDDRETAARDIESLLEAGAELGGAGLIIVPEFGAEKFMALYPDHGDFERRKEEFASRLAPLAQRAEALGVQILLEPLNRYETFFMLTIGQGAEICRMIGSPAVRVMADLFHAGIEEDNFVGAIEENAEFIAHVHLVDTNRMLPGLGDRDFKPAFDALERSGFDGYACIECGITGRPAQDVPASIEFFRKMLRG